MRRLGSAIVVALAWWPIQARAQAPNDEAVRFQYQAPAECPDVATFTGRVRERTARGRLAEPGELARSFVVAIAAEARGFLGSVEFLDDSGQSVSRRVHGEQCDELVSSLALITALALDASLRPEQVEPAKPAEVRPTRLEVETARPEIDVFVGRVTRWQAQVYRGPNARVGVAGGYSAPLQAFALGVMGQLDWPRALGVRLTAHHATADRDVTPERRANLRLMGVEASVCPPSLLNGRVFFYACGMVDVGSLRAEGLPSPGLISLDSHTIFWAALGSEARLAWEPDAPFWLELNGRVLFPLVSHEFVFEAPRNTVFEVLPVVSTSFGAGVVTGVRFW